MNFLYRIILFSLVVYMMTGCYVKKKEEAYPDAFTDTATKVFNKQGILINTGTSKGLPNAIVSIYSFTVINGIFKDTLFCRTTTDSNGFFRARFRAMRMAWDVKYVFEHADPVFIKRTYKESDSHDKINDSTGLFYLHRRPACRIALKNTDGKSKNVMLFNSGQTFSKLLMGLQKDTGFVYLMKDFTDVINFDYYPQKQLQSISLRGATSGDTLDVEFKY